MLCYDHSLMLTRLHSHYDCFLRAMNRWTFLPVPEQAIKLVYGEMGNEMLLGGRACTPKKLIDAGFTFKDTDIEATLRTIMTQKL